MHVLAKALKKMNRKDPSFTSCPPPRKAFQKGLIAIKAQLTAGKSRDETDQSKQQDKLHNKKNFPHDSTGI